MLDACLLPTFRLPTLIHTRSGGAKWLNEISQRNPIWIHTSDARRLAGPAGESLRTGDLVRINTEIGWFVDKVWVTESIRPGVVACSHHLGRWRRREDPPNSRWSGSIVSLTRAGDPIRAPSASAGGAAAPIASPEFTTAPCADADVTVASSPDAKLPAPSASAQASATPAPPVRVQSLGDGLWRMRIESGPEPFDSPDPDSRRIWWRDGGVPQNLTHAVHADPISGMHCWHQRVTVERARDGDRCGDVCVDTNKSMEVYRDWLRRTRWPVGPGDLRRPAWLNRPLRPTESAYRLGRET